MFRFLECEQGKALVPNTALDLITENQA